MSAYRYLLFVSGVILVALFGAFMLEIMTPTIDMLNTFSSTPESATGIGWYAEFVDLLPLVMLFLLAFMFLYGVVVRRRGVGR
jgi:uncharacterized BrkB/YihY/UPF0761 family membrane protein